MPRGKSKPFPISLIRILMWFGLISILCYIFIFGKSGYLVRAKLEHRVLQLEEEISKLKKANEKLRKEIEALHSPLYVERLARELGMAKPGEEIVEFIKKEKKE
jgi:cell division protein FtsB